MLFTLYLTKLNICSNMNILVSYGYVTMIILHVSFNCLIFMVFNVKSGWIIREFCGQEVTLRTTPGTLFLVR